MLLEGFSFGHFDDEEYDPLDHGNHESNQKQVESDGRGRLECYVEQEVDHGLCFEPIKRVCEVWDL